MKLLTHNLLSSHVRGLRPGGGFPLQIQVPVPSPVPPPPLPGTVRAPPPGGPHFRVRPRSSP